MSKFADRLKALRERATPGEWHVYVEEYDADSNVGSISIVEINRLLHDSEWATPDEWDQDMANADYITYLANHAERLEAVVRAAKDVSDTLNGGFIVCSRCGYQEDTTDIDFADELRKALAALEKEE